MPIRTAPRFCLGGYGRFEKLLYGCRNPSRWWKPIALGQNRCWKLGMSVLILVSNGDIQRSNRICSQDQHAQAQHWLRHAQAQLMHAQHWPRTQSRSRQGGGCSPLPCSHLGPRPMLGMHKLSLPEPILSLSMLILATFHEAAIVLRYACLGRGPPRAV